MDQKLTTGALRPGNAGTFRLLEQGLTALVDLCDFFDLCALVDPCDFFDLCALVDPCDLLTCVHSLTSVTLILQGTGRSTSPSSSS